MAFKPEPNQELIISNVLYSIAEHPAARGMPYGQEGRAAIVYQIKSEKGDQALKVFKPRFRLPWLVGLTEQLTEFADLPGLRVCQRSVITALRQTNLVRAHPDLSYAVVMPWIEGPTWMEVLLECKEMSPETSLMLARSFANILALMEEQRTAHCDLSGPNVLLPALAPDSDGSYPSAIELVDVEQMYGPGLDRPEFVPGGSPGYAAHRAHRSAPQGLWEPKADRFAGAVLLAEMLCWCDPRIRDASWGESYYDPDEMQQDNERYRIMMTVLQERWGTDIRELFERVWASDTLSDCPTFGDWFVRLPADVPIMVSTPEAIKQPVEAGPPTTTDGRDGASAAAISAGTTAALGAGLTATTPDLTAESLSVNALMEKAAQLEQSGDLVGALEMYRQASAAAPAGSGLQHELSLIATHLQTQIYGEAAAQAGPSEDLVKSLMNKALEQEAQGDRAGALKSYRQALALAPADSGLQHELILITHQLQGLVAAPTATPEAQVAPTAPTVETATVQTPMGTAPVETTASIAAPTTPIEQIDSTPAIAETTPPVAETQPIEVETASARVAAGEPETAEAARRVEERKPGPQAESELIVPPSTPSRTPQITTVVGAVTPTAAAPTAAAGPTIASPATAPASTSTVATVSTASVQAPTVAVPTQPHTNVQVTTARKAGRPGWIIPAIFGAVLLLFGGIAVAAFMAMSGGGPIGPAATPTAQAANTPTVPIVAVADVTATREARATSTARAALIAFVAGETATARVQATRKIEATVAPTKPAPPTEPPATPAPPTPEPATPAPPTPVPATPVPPTPVPPTPVPPTPVPPTPVPPTPDRAATAAALSMQGTAQSIEATAKALDQAAKNQQATIAAQNAAATRVAQQATQVAQQATAAAQQATAAAQAATAKAIQQATAVAQQATAAAQQAAQKTAQAIQQATAAAEKAIRNAQATAAAQAAATQTKLAEPPPPPPTKTPIPNFCPGVPNRVNMLIGKGGGGKLLGNCGPAGTEFAFIGSGFRAGETVTVTVTAPSGYTYGTPVILNTNANGDSETFSLKTTPDFAQGIWTIIMTGDTSGRSAIGYIKILAP